MGSDMVSWDFQQNWERAQEKKKLLQAEFLIVPSTVVGTHFRFGKGHDAWLRSLCNEHVLQFKDARTIACKRCPAEWRSHSW